MSSYEDKKAFFTQLDALSTADNDEFDEEEILQRRKSRAFFMPKGIKSQLHPAVRNGPDSTPRRVLSAPATASTSQINIIEATPLERNTRAIPSRASAQSSSAVEETPVSDSARPPQPALQRSSTTPLPSRSTLSAPSPSIKPGLKRKRQAKEKCVPEKDQVFRGLSFFYIPNNDVAPVRKMRIQSAMEHGATWVRRPADASHVIVDKELKYKDIKDQLESANSKPCPVVVNEDFPLDCVSWKRVLNPGQQKYNVQGYPSLRDPIPAREAEQYSPQSRALQQSSSPLTRPQREAKERDYVRFEETAPREDEHRLRVAERTAPKMPRAKSRRESDSSLPSNEATAKVAPFQRPSHHPRIRSTHSLREDTAGKEDAGEEDELSKYIKLARDCQELPLDSEDDPDLSEEAQETTSVPDDRSDGEAVGEKRGSRGDLSRRKNIAFEERFVCHTGGTLDTVKPSQSPNARTIEILQSMCAYYERTDDQWRHQSYRKAVTLLKTQSFKITTVEQAMALPGIGRRLAEKIVEIVNTDKLEKLEITRTDPHVHALELFMGIYDVGNSRARKWIDQGFRTLNDIREKADLTPNQRLGLEHYEDLNNRIPRSEIHALGEYVKKEAAKINPDVELLIGGSYRRGSLSSGDIDLIVTKKGTTSPTELVPFLNELVDNLMQQGFLTAVLAGLYSYRPGKDGPGSKWHGCCVLPRIPGGRNDNNDYRPVWRRIDFLLVPETEYGAALLYFTGNDIFNRSIRLLASKKGMRLNQRGLYKNVLRGSTRVKHTGGELLEGRDEKKIFEILGVKWREPEERWC